MSKQDNLHDFLTDIADAVREKKGTSEKINAQNLSSEIRSIESGGGGQWAVDFGEEIASNNAAFLGALQEDIDYYNEVVRSVESGELKDDDYLDYKKGVTERMMEFRRRIAWWPKDFHTYKMEFDKSYTNLKSYIKPEYKITNGYYLFMGCGSLEYVTADFSKCTNLNMTFKGCASLREVDLQNAPVTNFSNTFYGCYNLRSVKGLNTSEATNAQNMFLACYSLSGKIELDFPKATNISNILEGSYMLNEVVINAPLITSLTFWPRGITSLKKITVNFPSLGNWNNPFYAGTTNVEDAYISGLKCSLNIPHLQKLTPESIKYIIDNCQQSGTSYTLTLHADVKAAFEAKCAQDAEYAASLANAIEKGLTIA